MPSALSISANTVAMKFGSFTVRGENPAWRQTAIASSNELRAPLHIGELSPISCIRAAERTAPTRCRRLRDVESIKIHYLVPGHDKVVNKLLLHIGTGVNFGQRAELRV